MTNINDRITKIKEYFLGMDVKDGIIDVAVQFPRRWVIVSGLDEKYGIVIDECKNIEGSPFSDKPNSFYFGASLEDGFDLLFDAIDENIRIMQLAEERAELLDKKLQELRAIFDDGKNTVEMLKTLEFTFRSRGRGKQKTNFQEKTETERKNNDNVETIEEENKCQAD